MEKRVLAAAILVVAVLGVLGLTLHRNRGVGGVALVDPRMEALVEGAPESLRVGVSGIVDGWFEREYTCDGGDRVPRVVVEGVPSSARAVALIVYDPDAPRGTFIHWLAVAPAGGDTVVFPSEGMVEGRNDFGRIGYGGPCPPRGHGPHRYFFLALALDRDPGLARGFRLGQLVDAVRGHVLAWGYSMGRYER